MAETYRPPAGVQEEAARALEWIADGKAGSGFTDTGRARASQLANGEAVSADTILRMYSFFKRHEVDKSAPGFNAGEDGFPSAGRVAWSAWGGDAGFSWSTKIRNQIAERSASLLKGVNMDSRDTSVSPSISNLVEELQELLGDVFGLYVQAHGAHWNVKGSNFSEYHKLFGEIYEDVWASVDDTAENLRKLGAFAPFSISDFVGIADFELVQADKNQDPALLVNALINGNNIVLDQLNEVLQCATACNQQGLVNFIAGRIDEHQKWNWQLTVSIGQEVAPVIPEAYDVEESDEESSEIMGSIVPVAERKASGSMDLPLGNRDDEWDASAAEGRVRTWASSDGNVDWEKYGKAFFYVDASAPDKFGSYKLQFADVVGSTLTAIPRGIFAVAGVLAGARGGVDIPSDEQDAIKDKVAEYYDKMANKFGDKTMTAPFEDRASTARIGEGTFVSWESGAGRARGKVEKVITKGPASSSEGFTLEATPDYPVFLIRIYESKGSGWVPSDTTVVHRNDLLTVIGALPAPRSSEENDMIEERKSAMASAERVTMDCEVRSLATDDASLRIGGYAAMFNKEATGLSFREMIAPGAFTRTLQSGNPVFLLVNHDMDALPLASTGSGTMSLREDEQGLWMEADLDSANPRANELASAISRGDVSKMSFAFTVAPGGDSRKDGLRTLKDLNLFEVSVVTLPAYDSTSVGMRTADEEGAEAEALLLRKRLLELKQKFNSVK